MKIPPPDQILTTRSSITESTHLIHAAIVSRSNSLLYAVGNPSRLTLARSTAKPAQALAILSTGAFNAYPFDEADLALMCASHSSEARHITRAQSMLSKIDGDADDFRCGGHAALSESVNRSWIRRGVVPGGIQNNCSGKHVGMMAAAKVLGEGVQGYHLPGSGMQGRVREVVNGLCSRDGQGEGIEWGVDGCNLPAPAMELRDLARLYALLAAGVDTVEGGHQEQVSERERNLGRIYKAMVGYPELVAGEGRFCTVLMEKYGGALVGKLGADGCYGVAVRESEATRVLGAEGAIGIAVKVEDGNIGILYAAVMEILEQLGIGTEAVRGELGDFHYPQILNTAGVVTGGVRHSFKVRAL